MACTQVSAPRCDVYVLVVQLHLGCCNGCFIGIAPCDRRQSLQSQHVMSSEVKIHYDIAWQVIKSLMQLCAPKLGSQGVEQATHIQATMYKPGETRTALSTARYGAVALSLPQLLPRPADPLHAPAPAVAQG